MIRVHVFHLTRADLAKIPEPDRALMLLSGHTLNQLGLWMKLIALATNADNEDDPGRDRLNGAQSQILVRNLAASLAEAWEWLRRSESALLIGKKYSPLLPPEARNSYADLKKRFGSSGLLHGVRNNFTYHYPTTQAISDSFGKTVEDEDFSWYVTDENTSSFYFGCEMVVGYGVIRSAPGDTDIERMTALLHETVHTANSMADFLQGMLLVILNTYIPNPKRSISEIHDAPKGPRALPFYYENVTARFR